VERLTSEQIRLLEELRELRDAGILTIDEFEFQVAKVLGRPLVVEPSPVDEEPVKPAEADETQQSEQSDVVDVVLTPDTSHETELLEYEFDEPGTSDQDGIMIEKNQAVEPLPISESLASAVVETEIQQSNSSRRKALIGTTIGLVLIAVIGLVTLVGGKSDTASTQIVDNTTTVTQSTTPMTTKAPTASTTTTTEVIPTTTYEVLQCPYTRTIAAVDGKIVTPEGILIEVSPMTDRSVTKEFATSYGLRGNIEVNNSTNFRIRIGMQMEWSWVGGSESVTWAPNEGRGWFSGFESGLVAIPLHGVSSQDEISEFNLKMISATIKYLCP